MGARGLNVSPVGNVKIPEGSKFPLPLLFDNCSPELLILARHEQIRSFIQTHHQWLTVFSPKTIQADLQCQRSFNYSRYVSSNLSTLSSA